jgi:hypothetical protein
MAERIAYWAFGLILAGALAAGVGKPLVAERGRKVVPALVSAAALLGLAFGWAINAYIDYVRASATLHY